MHYMAVQRCGQSLWLDGVRFSLGTASGNRNNCLIDTLRQKLDLVCSTAYVREKLQEAFPGPGPSHVTEDNFLTLEFHATEIIRLLGEAVGQRLRPQSFRIVCVDLEYMGHGDVVGEGPVMLHIARENGNHFVPLEKAG